MSEAAVEELWAALDSIFNAGYGGDGYYDIVGEEGIKKLKKTETCLELLYGQMQTSKQSWEAEGENCRKYFGALTILTPLERRYTVILNLTTKRAIYAFTQTFSRDPSAGRSSPRVTRSCCRGSKN